MPSTDDVTPFFEAKTKKSTANRTHRTIKDVPRDNGVRYVLIDPPSDGWLRTKEGDADVYLFAYTKVKLKNRESSRVYFKVLDGISNVGKTVS